MVRNEHSCHAYILGKVREKLAEQCNPLQTWNQATKPDPQNLCSKRRPVCRGCLEWRGKLPFDEPWTEWEINICSRGGGNPETNEICREHGDIEDEDREGFPYPIDYLCPDCEEKAEQERARKFKEEERKRQEKRREQDAEGHRRRYHAKNPRSSYRVTKHTGRSGTQSGTSHADPNTTTTEAQHTANSVKKRDFASPVAVAQDTASHKSIAKPPGSVKPRPAVNKPAVSQSLKPMAIPKASATQKGSHSTFFMPGASSKPTEVRKNVFPGKATKHASASTPADTTKRVISTSRVKPVTASPPTKPMPKTATPSKKPKPVAAFKPVATSLSTKDKEKNKHVLDLAGGVSKISIRTKKKN